MSQPATRVLHVVVAGLGWGRLDPLLQHGLMPQLAQWCEQGSRGVLRAIQPQVAIQIEHSLLTGVPAHRHGLLHPLRLEAQGPRASTSADARVAGLPDWMRAAQRPALFIGWPHLEPCCDDTQLRVPRLSVFDPRLDAIWPAEMTAQRVPLERIGVEHLKPFFGEVPADALESDAAALPLRTLLASASSLQGIATWAMQRRDWQLCSVHIDFIDEAERLFGAFHPPASEHIDRAALLHYQHVLTGCYRFLDMLLGRLAALAGPQATLVLHGDQGTLKRTPPSSADQPVHVRHRAAHDERAALLLAGSMVQGGTPCWASTTLDVAPTLNRLLGLAPAGSLPGRWLAEALDAERLPPPTPCEAEPETARDPMFADCLLEERHARGETGTVFEGGDQADEAELLEALSLMQDGAVGEAMSRLCAINERKPDWRRAVLHRARCHLALSQLDEAEHWISRFLELGVPDLRSHLMLGQISLRRGAKDRALIHFFQAEQLQPEEPVSHCQIADAYRAAGRLEDARRAYERALQFDAAHAPALLGLAKLALIDEQPAKATEACLRALESDYRNADTHFHLGVSLARDKQSRAAITAFETSLKLDAAKWQAHEWLSRLFRLLDDGALRAAEHAVQAKRLRGANAGTREAADD